MRRIAEEEEEDEYKREGYRKEKSVEGGKRRLYGGEVERQVIL